MIKQTKSFTSLKAWRQRMGLSQREAALILGISQPGYSKLECGQRVPRPPKAKAISRKTGVPFENLLGVA